MKNNHNRSLYWYGFKAKVKVFFGKVGILLGLLISFLGLASDSSFILLGLLFIGLGVWGCAVGTSQRFDYKQQSGSMIHRGDW